MKMFSVKTIAKNVVITFVSTVFFLWLLCFGVATAIPLLFGIFVYKAFTFMETENELAGFLKIVYFLYKIICIFNI